ncbi:MAG: hypothetical protein WCJ64_23660 [Rhodospirillaceae bacterium]
MVGGARPVHRTAPPPMPPSCAKPSRPTSWQGKLAILAEQAMGLVAPVRLRLASRVCSHFSSSPIRDHSRSSTTVGSVGCNR